MKIKHTISRRLCVKGALARSLRASVAALAFGPVLSAPSHALYKCGNTYQDKPCASGATESAVNPALRLAAGAPSAGASPGPAVPPKSGAGPGFPSAANSASPFAPACGRIGQAAQQMVWKREVGATREKQLTDLPQGAAHAEMVKTLDSVYSRRGSAATMQNYNDKKRKLETAISDAKC